MKLEDYIFIHAKTHSEKCAIICEDTFLTYKQLADNIYNRIAFWNSCIPQHQQVVTLRASQKAEFLVDYFALHSIGKTVAPLEHSMPESQFMEIAEVLNNSRVPDGMADILYTTGTTGQSKTRRGNDIKFKRGYDKSRNNYC